MPTIPLQSRWSPTRDNVELDQISFLFLFLCLTSLLTVTEPRHFCHLCHTSPRRRLLPLCKFTTTTTTTTLPCELQTPPLTPCRHNTQTQDLADDDELGFSLWLYGHRCSCLAVSPCVSSWPRLPPATTSTASNSPHESPRSHVTTCKTHHDGTLNTIRKTYHSCDYAPVKPHDASSRPRRHHSHPGPCHANYATPPPPRRDPNTARKTSRSL
ncbi:hypothetical protein EDB89DRAFT_1537757 [Lactarius sanguifluus]|nr:hypothetical protein EDB89DRAFT_1537757 [Lactarius sanguifluus]